MTNPLPPADEAALVDCAAVLARMRARRHPRPPLRLTADRIRATQITMGHQIAPDALYASLPPMWRPATDRIRTAPLFEARP